jgi:hypothetical protein
MMPGLPVPSIPQFTQNRHNGACLEIFQVIGSFEHPFIEAHQALKMIHDVRSLKSRKKTGSFLYVIITSRKEMIKHFESDMAVRIRMLRDMTQETAECNNTEKQTVDS